MKDDKKPEESLNSGENHVREALSDLKSFDSRREATAKTAMTTQVKLKAPIGQQKDSKIQASQLPLQEPKRTGSAKPN